MTTTNKSNNQITKSDKIKVTNNQKISCCKWVLIIGGGVLMLGILFNIILGVYPLTASKLM